MEEVKRVGKGYESREGKPRGGKRSKRVWRPSRPCRKIGCRRQNKLPAKWSGTAMNVNTEGPTQGAA